MELTIFEFSIFTSAEPEAMMPVPMVALLFSMADEEAVADSVAAEAMMRSEMVAAFDSRFTNLDS